MNEQQTLLCDTAERLFMDLTASRPEDEQNTGQFHSRWRQFAEIDLEQLLVPEDKGGFGGGPIEAWLIFRLVGLYAIDLPIVEAITATGLLSGAELDIPDGMLTIAPRVEGGLVAANGGWRFSGELKRVPWGRFADHVIGLVKHEAGQRVVCLPVVQADRVCHRTNAADEPRDDFSFSGCKVAISPAAGRTPEMLTIGALARAAQIAGACRGALDLTRTYANDREQFGRPLAKFQAIQHMIATLAEHARAAEAASRAAFETVCHGVGVLEVASAKIIANIAAEQAISIAHQTHGAMGFTWEYSLHQFTRRLIAWGSEFGNLRCWDSALGALVAATGPKALWPLIVEGSRQH